MIKNLNQNNPVKIDLVKLKTDQCPCGSFLWKDVKFIKRIPGIMVAQKNEQLLIQSILVCSKCDMPHPSNDRGMAKIYLHLLRGMDFIIENEGTEEAQEGKEKPPAETPESGEGV